MLRSPPEPVDQRKPFADILLPPWRQTSDHQVKSCNRAPAGYVTAPRPPRQIGKQGCETGAGLPDEKPRGEFLPDSARPHSNPSTAASSAAARESGRVARVPIIPRRPSAKTP